MGTILQITLEICVLMLKRICVSLKSVTGGTSCLRKGRTRQGEMLCWSLCSLAVLLTIPNSFRCVSKYAIHRVNVRYTEMLAGKEKGNITVAGKAVRFGCDVYGQSKA